MQKPFFKKQDHALGSMQSSEPHLPGDEPVASDEGAYRPLMQQDFEKSVIRISAEIYACTYLLIAVFALAGWIIFLPLVGAIYRLIINFI